MRNTLSAWAQNPRYQIDIMKLDFNVTIVIEGVKIADSQRVLLLREQHYTPICYFPKIDVQMARLTKTDKVTLCPFKGAAEHWALQLTDREIRVAAWSYQNPFEQVYEIKDYMAFYPEVMDYNVFY